jgi:hypothetical protein
MFAESSQEVQDECPVLNRLTKVSECVGHALHLATIVVDRESSLGQGAKLSVEEHGAGLAVVQELMFQPKPCNPSRDTGGCMDDIQEVAEMVLKIQETTTKSMRVQAGSWRRQTSLRTWSASANIPRVRRT